MSMFSGVKVKVSRKVDLPIITTVLAALACCYFVIIAWLNSKRLANDILVLPEDELRSRLNILCPKPLNESIKPLCEVDEQIDISIIIPIYNVASFLQQSIESVLQQKTSARLEIICVNDGSTDSSGVILERIAQTDHRIKVIHQLNGGLSRARNSGIAAARGSCLMFLDSDDVLLDNAIDCAFKVLIENDADIVVGGFVSFSNDVPDVKLNIESTTSHLVDPRHAYGAIKDGYAWGKLYKRSLWQNVRFPDGYQFEDTMIKPIIFRLADRIAICDVPFVGYRLHEASLTAIKNKERHTAIFVLWLVEMTLEQNISVNLPLDDVFELFLVHQLTKVINMRSKYVPSETTALIFQYIQVIVANLPTVRGGTELQQAAWKGISDNDIRKWYFNSQLAALEL